MLWFSSFIPGLNYHALPYPETKENKIYTKDKIKLQHIYPAFNLDNTSERPKLRRSTGIYITCRPGILFIKTVP